MKMRGSPSKSQKAGATLKQRKSVKYQKLPEAIEMSKLPNREEEIEGDPLKNLIGNSAF
jgi:hypothetical protein